MFEDYRGKTVLLTGDTGFKGSWLAIWLRELGARVVGVALPPMNERDNYVVCGLSDKMFHTNLDIRNLDQLLEEFQRNQPDIVFHLAAQALVIDGYQNPVGTFNSNVQGTVHVLEAIRRTPSVRAGVMITSDKCYENEEWIYGYRENDRLGGKDPYSASKGAAEIVIASYRSSFFSDEKAAAIASARAGNVIGGGDWSPNRIVPDCIRSLEKGEPILVRNPSAVRPWQHVLEPLGGYLTLGEKLLREGQRYAGGWNFGPQPRNMITVKELAERCIEMWGSGMINSPNDLSRHHEAHFLHLDISKAMNFLSWHPKLDFDATMKLTVEEYRIRGESPEDIYQQRADHIATYSTL